MVNNGADAHPKTQRLHGQFQPPPNPAQGLGGDIQVRSQVAQWNTTGNLRLFAEEEAVAADRILAGINVL